MRNVWRRPGIWVLIVVAVVAITGVGLQLRGPAVRVANPQRRDLEQHLVVSGRVRVPTRVQIASQLSGLVVTVGAIEGQRVQKGDLLVQLDDLRA